MSTLHISQKCCLSPDTSTAEPLITYTTVLGVAVGYIGAHIIAVCCSKAAVHGTRTERWTSHQLHCRRRLHCCPWPWGHGRKGQTLGSQNRCVLNCFDVKVAIPDHAMPCCIVPHCIIGVGIAQRLEHQTHDWKVAGSNPCTSGGRIFFSGVNFLWWLFVSVTAPPLFYCSST